MSRGMVGVVLVLFAVAWALPAGAAPKYAPKPFKVGASAGFLYGLAGTLRVGDAFGIEAAGGAQLVLLSYSEFDDSPRFFAEERVLRFEPTWRFSALPFARVFGKPGRRTSMRIGPFAQYDTLLSYGLGGAGVVDVRVGQSWSVDLAWGILVFPEAGARLRREEVPEGAEFNFPPGINWGLNVGLSFLP